MANPTTYHELYSSHRAPEDVAKYFELFDRNSAVPPGQRFSQFVDAPNNHPKMLLYLARDPLGHLLGRFVHGVFRFPSVPGTTTQLDDKIFGFPGKVDEQQCVNTLEIPRKALHVTGDTVVPLMNEMNDAWAQAVLLNPAAPMLGPYPAASHMTESIRVPIYMGIPGTMARKILDKGFMTPRELWEQFCAPLVGMVDELLWAPFLAWGRAACTWSKKDQNVLLKKGPTHPMFDKHLCLAVREKVLQDLPVFAPVPPTVPVPVIAPPVLGGPTPPAVPTPTVPPTTVTTGGLTLELQQALTMVLKSQVQQGQDL